MIEYLIGVDGGGTATRALVARTSGPVLGEGHAGPSALGQGIAPAWREVERAVARCVSGGRPASAAMAALCPRCRLVRRQQSAVARRVRRTQHRFRAARSRYRWLHDAARRAWRRARRDRRCRHRQRRRGAAPGRIALHRRRLGLSGRRRRQRRVAGPARGATSHRCAMDGRINAGALARHVWATCGGRPRRACRLVRPRRPVRVRAARAGRSSMPRPPDPAAAHLLVGAVASLDAIGASRSTRTAGCRSRCAAASGSRLRLACLRPCAAAASRPPPARPPVRSR